MPDWSYRTLFRPLLLRMAPRTARALTLGAMGAVGRLPGGRLLIRTMGHAELPSELAAALGSLPVRSPVGLGGRVDPAGTAHRALAQLGIGYIELGTVSLGSQPDTEPMRMDAEDEAIVYGGGGSGDEGADAAARLLDARRDVPYAVRLRPSTSASVEAALREFEAAAARVLRADAFFAALPAAADWSGDETDRYRQGALAALRRLAPGKPALLDWPCEPLEPSELSGPGGSDFDLRLEAAERQGWDGYVVRGELPAGDGGGLVIGRAAKDGVLAAVRRLRASAASGRTIIAAGGMHEPSDAAEAREAGADLVQLDSGFVYGGPGLPKRMNEVLLYERVRHEPPEPEPSYWRGWGWMTLLGIAMMLGGLAAWAIADTSVLLPYDEKFLGATRAQVDTWNSRLLHFMSHDRITLAGTMIAIGIFYYQLGHYGLRQGLHWARTALLVSGIAGFASFFLYVGYGYFDPLHAAAAAVLLPMFLLAMAGHRDRLPRTPPNRTGDAVWRRAMWGQLCWVAMSAGFLVGGLAIAGVGVTGVFVASDLVFLGASAEELAALNERLLPLIAHDRAGFGGALFSLACAMTACSLWGIGQGARWLWLTFLAGGIPGFAAGLGIHIHIGYSDFLHLLPVYVQLILWTAGLILLYPYMMRKTV